MVDDPNYPSVTFGVLEQPPGFRRKQVFAAYQAWNSGSSLDDAEVSAASIPDFVRPGSTHLLPITMLNSGATTWTAAEIRFRPEIAIGWNLQGGQMNSGTEVEPGSSITLHLKLSVPIGLPDDDPLAVELRGRMERVDEWFFGEAVVRSIVRSDTTPPEVLVPPRSRTVAAGESTTLSLTAISTGRLRYQWRRNTIDLEDDHCAGPPAQ